MGFVGCVRKDGFDLEKLYNAVSDEVAKENPDCETALKTINAAVAILMKEKDQTTQDFKTRKNTLVALKGMVLIRDGKANEGNKFLRISSQFFLKLKESEGSLSNFESRVFGKSLFSMGIISGKIQVVN